jgi:hypothetical protein
MDIIMNNLANTLASWLSGSNTDQTSANININQPSIRLEIDINSTFTQPNIELPPIELSPIELQLAIGTPLPDIIEGPYQLRGRFLQDISGTEARQGLNTVLSTMMAAERPIAEAANAAIHASAAAQLAADAANNAAEAIRSTAPAA